MPDRRQTLLHGGRTQAILGHLFYVGRHVPGLEAAYVGDAGGSIQALKWATAFEYARRGCELRSAAKKSMKAATPTGPVASMATMVAGTWCMGGAAGLNMTRLPGVIE